MQSAQIEQLIERNRELEGENQLLKFKVNYLMDMVSSIFYISKLINDINDI